MHTKRSILVEAMGLDSWILRCHIGLPPVLKFFMRVKNVFPPLKLITLQDFSLDDVFIDVNRLWNIGCLYEFVFFSCLDHLLRLFSPSIILLNILANVSPSDSPHCNLPVPSHPCIPQLNHLNLLQAFLHPFLMLLRRHVFILIFFYLLLLKVDAHYFNS